MAVNYICYRWQSKKTHAITPSPASTHERKLAANWSLHVSLCPLLPINKTS